MKLSMSAVLVALLIVLFVVAPVAYSEVAGVSYIVSYSIVDDTGFLVVEVNVTETNCLAYYIPVNILDEQAVVEFLNYTSTGTGVVGVKYDGEQGLVELIACNPGTVELLFSVSNILEEQSLGTYSLFVDTSVLRNYGNVVFELRLGIPVNFEVSLSGGTVVEAVYEDQGILRLRGTGLSMITILIPLEEVEQTPTSTLTPTAQPPRAEVPFLYIALAVIAVVIVAVAVILITRRK
ncbi:MAG: hypothetical protein QXS14_05065 [Desulfurococcaceae archaeon]